MKHERGLAIAAALVLWTCGCSKWASQYPGAESPRNLARLLRAKAVRPELASLVRAIHDSPSIPHGEDIFDPTRLIQAVNALHAVGKDRALAALRLYTRWSRDPEVNNLYSVDPGQVSLIARLLFVKKDGGALVSPALSARCVGAYLPKGGEHLWPVIPLVVVEDWPFLLGEFLGVAEAGPFIAWFGSDPPEQYLDAAERSGRLRDRPLRPNISPLAAAERLDH